MWQVRQATGRDQEAVCALWLESGLTATEPREWEGLSQGRASTVLVADEEGAILGAVVAVYNGWRAYIYHLATLPSRRGQGIGGALLDSASDFLAQAGAAYVYVMVRHNNTSGLALVGQTGFLADGEIVLAKPLSIATQKTV